MFLVELNIKPHIVNCKRAEPNLHVSVLMLQPIHQIFHLQTLTLKPFQKYIYLFILMSNVTNIAFHLNLPRLLALVK